MSTFELIVTGLLIAISILLWLNLMVKNNVANKLSELVTLTQVTNSYSHDINTEFRDEMRLAVNELCSTSKENYEAINNISCVMDAYQKHKLPREID